MISVVIDENYERIRGDLVRRGLTYDRLLEDVLDHVCCMLEEEMDKGEDFESSYRRVLNDIPENQLPLIQHQTLLNLDKKFQRMKKITYVFGLISTLIMILGAVFKRVHLPGAGILLTVGILMTVLGFLPLYFRFSYLEMREKTKPIYSIVGYLTLSFILLGALFKSQHWPGAGVLLTVGVTMTVFVFLPFYFRSSYRELEEKKNPIFGIVGYITLVLLLAGALFKIMHWPGAGIIIYTSIGFLVVGFVPLYAVNLFQKSGKEKILLPYLVMVVVGISLVMLIGSVRIPKETLEVYRNEAVADEIRTEQIRERTAMLLEMAGDSLQPERIQLFKKIHQQAGELQSLIDGMQDGMKASVGESGVATGQIEAMYKMNAGRDVVLDSGMGQEFMDKAKIFRDLLKEVVRDPVTLSQIDYFLHYTGEIGGLEYGGADIAQSPMIRVYYKNGSAAWGIALSEYVAIVSLMHPE